MADLHEFVFDVKMFATFRVKAATKAEARAILHDRIDGGDDANFGAWPDGSPIIAQPAIDGTPDLIEIDGEDAEQPQHHRQQRITK